MRTLELLAPARDLATGIAAIESGADAVYIGAEKFGARKAAGNTLDDIAALTAYAHRYQARVYVTLNTILYDDELATVRQLVAALQARAVDALIVQDMAMVRLAADSGIALHASTQTDNRTAEKVAWLQEKGFRRTILARELSLKEISAIHSAVPAMELEAFVHGALCVSYSGRCYASQHFFARSANRGDCAQFCRMKFDLVDSIGSVIRRQEHLLSLKDLSLLSALEALADAGITAFKIEGRLKDIAYVRNVVSAYSQQLDRLCARRSDDYARRGQGIVDYHFTPDIAKTFNRGYTDYFLHGRQRGITSPHTPKAMGAKVGTVKEIRQNYILVAGVAAFANGDGLCFIDENNTLAGFRVNRADGNRLYPYQLPATLRKGMTLYRNSDSAFEKLLAKPVATRRLPLTLTLTTTNDGVALHGTSGSIRATAAVACAHTPAQTAQEENMRRQLSRWGDTIYKVTALTLSDDVRQLFIPASLLSTLRQTLAKRLEEARTPIPPLPTAPSAPPRAAQRHIASVNVSNSLARTLHHEWGIDDYECPPEVDSNHFAAPLMQCKHCLRYELGACTRHGGTAPTWHEPLFLRMSDGRRARISFDCDKCQMNVWSTDTTQKLP